MLGGASAACTSRGRLNRTVLRSTAARVHARARSSSADSGEWARSCTAPTAAASPAWSIRKLDWAAPAEVSAAITTSGVRAFAASVRAVVVLVRLPGP